MKRSNSQLVQTAIDDLAVRYPETVFFVRWKNVLPNDCGNSFHPYRHCDVAFIVCQAHFTGPFRADNAMG
jgi:hypothetical protein